MEEISNTNVGRPRDFVLRGRILQCGMQLVQESGYAATTIKHIAERANVGRPTIYRWWQTKAELLLEAVVEELAKEPIIGDSLEVFLQETFTLGRGVTGEIVVGLMGDAQRDKNFHKLLQDRLLVSRRAALHTILARYVSEQSSIQLDIVVDMIFGAMWYRLLDRHALLSDDFAIALSSAAKRLINPNAH